MVVLVDKRRSLWIAAEHCPDGEQIEEADLDILLPNCLGAPNAPDDSLNAISYGSSCERSFWKGPPPRRRHAYGLASSFSISAMACALSW